MIDLNMRFTYHHEHAKNKWELAQTLNRCTEDGFHVYAMIVYRQRQQLTDDIQIEDAEPSISAQ